MLASPRLARSVHRRVQRRRRLARHHAGHPVTGGGFTSSSSLHGLGGGGGGGVGSGFTSASQSPDASRDTSPAITPIQVGRSLRMQQPHLQQPLVDPTPYHVHQHHMDAPLVYDHTAGDDELWFDWMADCGDGWNSSYQVARVLAKPVLSVSVRRKGGRKPGALRLPRAKMLVIGGDLAYPSPSEATYETRFFRPFQVSDARRWR